MTYPYRVVFTAKSTARVWGDLGSNRNFELIHFALDAPRFQEELAAIDRDEARRRLGLEPGPLGVLLVGTICDRKGQRDLAAAFRLLPAEVASRMKYLIVGAPGEPDYTRDIRSMVAKLPADRRDRIEIVHGVKDTSSYWAAADLFCCTSRIESYPRVVLEAMAAGLPLVTTPVFGISEQVRDRVNALIYQPGDVQTLARHLATLATDEAMRRSFASDAPWVLRGLPDPARMDRLYLQTFLAAAESVAPTVEETRTSNDRGRSAIAPQRPHLAERSPSQTSASGRRVGA